jgi:hypothetical protein
VRDRARRPTEPPAIRVRANTSVPVPIVRAREMRTPRPPPPSTPLRFDIARMIELVRRLPDGDAAVVAHTLGAALASVGVTLPPVIEDAQRRQADLEDRLRVVEAEIEERVQTIDSLRREIAALETDHAETTMVRERLERAQRRA